MLTILRFACVGVLVACALACPIEHHPRGPYMVNQRDFPLAYRMRALRLPCAVLDHMQVEALTQGDFYPAQSFALDVRTVTSIEQHWPGGCAQPVLWVTVGDFDGLVIGQELLGANPEKITRSLLDASLLVEGDRDELFVTVGKKLRVLPAPAAGPPTLDFPMEVEQDSDASSSDASLSDAGDGG